MVIYQLQGEQYLEVLNSPTFPMVSKEKLYEFLAVAQRDEVEAEVNLRAWVHSSIEPKS